MSPEYSFDGCFVRHDMKVVGEQFFAMHIMPDDNPIRNRGNITFVYCKSDIYPNGFIIFAGSDDYTELGHHGLVEFAEECEELGEKIEGFWGGHLNANNLSLYRSSRGFPGKFDNTVFDSFLDMLSDTFK